eukprot:scaffold32689_cov75-Phaeocystis_antarctica.AAC.1
MGGKRHGLHERDSFRIGHDARQCDGAGVSGRHRLTQLEGDTPLLPPRRDRPLVSSSRLNRDESRCGRPRPSPQPLTLSPTLTLTTDEPVRRALRPRPAPASRRPAGIPPACSRRVAPTAPPRQYTAGVLQARGAHSGSNLNPSKWLLDLASKVLPAATENLLGLTDSPHRATLRRSPRALAEETWRPMSKVHSGVVVAYTQPASGL